MHTNDMTRGEPLRLILAFAVPLLIGNVFQQFYNVVDTMIAGYNLGDAAIAAIGATSSLSGLMINFVTGLNNGYGIVIARAFGSGDREELKSAIATTVVLDAAASLLLTAVSVAGLRPLLRLMNVPENILADATAYILIILAGMTATVLYNMVSGILRAVGNSKTPLWFLIFASLLNGVLDVLFVVVFRWGVCGAASATVIAQAVSALLSGVYLVKRYGDILPEKRHFRLEPRRVRQMNSTGLAMAVMLCVVDIGSVFYQRAVNELGATLIVAHVSARRIIVMFMMPLGSLATAGSTFISQNWGARKTERIRKALKTVLAAETVYAVAACAFGWAFGGMLVRILTATSDPEVIAKAVLSIRLHFSCYPALGALLALRTALQAIDRKLVPVVSSGFELGIKLLCGLWLIPSFGYIVVCLAEPVIWVVCMVFLFAVMVTGRPLRKAETELRADFSE
ncbi:MAG: MATE family efflux transporter [Clostridia bacterium]|nr:MATE family efflux transporter [Clostridia bacterium]